MKFGRATRAWFENAFSTATPVQQRGWESISTGAHSLLVAPTGSGKTLAAFLWCLDQLIHDARVTSGVRVLYVSPLKALAYDIERNLRAPLVGIERCARDLGLTVTMPQVGIRTGDTSPRERARLVSRPPPILVTTPESLYLLLGSRARATLTNVETVIIDEVHALAPTKRGAHLALSLERLARVNLRDPQRIGLSATARPTQTMARFLGGDRKVEIVDAAEPPRIDVRVVVPVADMTRPESGPVRRDRVGGANDQGPIAAEGLWSAIYPELLALIASHRASIVFVNSRGLCERLTKRLNEIAGQALCRSHHGSVSHLERRAIEEQLKAGQLRAIVATSSLELGIDMGAVDLVVLVESPGSVARGLQRVGRAGHNVGDVSHGRLFPKHRGDLLEAAVVVQRMRQGELESSRMPENPLDVLAQQIVASVAVEELSVTDLRQLVRRAANYATLPDSALTSVLDMLAGRYPSHAFANLVPRIHWDRNTDVLSPRRGSKMLALTSGGTIPDRGSYGVFMAESGARVGELDEEMVHEIVAGEVFTLGASSWRVERITRDQVLVHPAPGEMGRLPFWRGDGPGRPVELGRALGAFVRELLARPEAAAQAFLKKQCGLNTFARANLLAYMAEQRAVAGTVPTDQTLVIERFRDELGDWRICILSPFGARVHWPWALAIEARVAAKYGFEMQTLCSDDGIVLRCADSDDLPATDSLVPKPGEIEELVIHQLGGSALFASQFRENAARSLLMPRVRPGARTPLWVQRLKAQELLAVARQYPAFPVVVETYRSCLQDVFDVPELMRLLTDVETGQVRVVETETRGPSPFARSLVFAYVAAFLYEGDTPLAERRVQALTLDRDLLREVLGQEPPPALDGDVVATVADELQSLVAERRAVHADALHDLLRRLGDLSDGEMAERCAGDAQTWLGELVESGRAARIWVAGQSRAIAAQDAGLYRDALGSAPPDGLPAAFLEPVADGLFELVRRYASTRGPFSVAAVAERFGVAHQELEPALQRLVDTALTVDLGVSSADSRQFCDAKVLVRIKRRTLAKLRAEIAPVSAHAVQRFLPAWHGIGRGELGTAALRRAIVQLEGVPISFADLETLVLPSRVPDFAPHMLDELGASGWLTWVGFGALGAHDGRVGLFRRDRVALLLDPRESPQALGTLAGALLEFLCTRGASFFVAIRQAFAAESLVDLVSAIRELAWSGLVTNDTFAPLRIRTPLRPNPGRGHTQELLKSVGGRWSATRELIAQAPSATECLYARAEKLLERHGIVGREVQSLEPWPGGFAAIYAVLGHMEELGKIRRGYFVDGAGGAQFALPGAVDRLRAIATSAADPSAVVIAACDPANPLGWLVPWPARKDQSGPAPKRVPGALVVFVGGEVAMYFRPSGKHLLTFPGCASNGTFGVAIAALTQALTRRSRGVVRLNFIDDVRASASEFADGLIRAGFRRTSNGFEKES